MKPITKEIVYKLVLEAYDNTDKPYVHVGHDDKVFIKFTYLLNKYFFDESMKDVIYGEEDT